MAAGEPVSGIYSEILEKKAEPDRPVVCWFCGKKMYYRGDPKFVPEVKICFSDLDRKDQYIHTNCLITLESIIKSFRSNEGKPKRSSLVHRMLRIQ